MKSLLSSCAVFLLVCSSFAQKPPIKAGSVSMDELKMKRYEPDTSAAAVILADYGESLISYSQNHGFQLTFERIKRIKILKKDGYEWADFAISLYHSGSNEEKLANLKAVTYNLENGKIVQSKASSAAIFKEKVDANHTLVKVTLPNVTEGSVLEISYKVISDFLFNFQNWDFQSTIPTLWSEYRARIPEYFTYDIYMQGYIPLSIREETSAQQSIIINSKEREEGRVTQTTFSQDKIEYKEIRQRWAVGDVPAFKPEPFITTHRDYISRINFELAQIKYPNQPIQNVIGSWENLNKKFLELEDFAMQITSNGFLKKIVEDLTAGITDPQKKVAVIYNYVKSHVAWDGSTRKFVSTSLKKVLDEQKGSSAEINFLLMAMLHRANINVSPVLISTRDHGFVRINVPQSSQFNYVLCLAEANGEQILLDATDRLLPMNILPQRCLNGSGYIISKTNPGWIKLQSSARARTVVNADLRIMPQGEIDAKLDYLREGYDAYTTRKKYHINGEESYIKGFTQGKSWDLQESALTNMSEIYEPVKEAYHFTVVDGGPPSPSSIYLNPFFDGRIHQNPFKSETRAYPVDFTNPFESVYMVKLAIPEGYEVDELPKSKVIALPQNAARFLYNVNVLNGAVNITSSLAINQPTFTQLEYENLREFYNQVVALQASQIVLKKK